MVEFWLRHRKNPDIVDRGSPSERAVIRSSEWTLLEELVARLRLDEQHLTSPDFKNETEDQLRANVPAPEVVLSLRNIARANGSCQWPLSNSALHRA